MQNNYSIWVRRCVILFAMMFMVCGKTAYAANSSKTVVRVGYFDLGTYYNVNSAGVMRSYDEAFLDEVSKYSKYEFTYVDCKTWDNALAMLNKHQIDLIGTMQWTAERENQYEICDASYGYSVAELAALKSSKIIYEDYAAMADAKVGCVGGYVITNQLKKFMKREKLSFKIVHYNTQTELDTALEKGDIDMVAANAHALHDDWKVVEKIAYAPFYFASWKGNSVLTDAISEGIIQIHVYQSDFADSLIKEYFPQLVNSPYTKNELDLVAKQKQYSIYFDGNTAPLVWYDETAKMKGVLVDVCEQLSTQTGINLAIKHRTGKKLTPDDYTVTYRTIYYDSETDARKEKGVTNAILDQNFELYRRVSNKYHEGGSYRIAIVANRDGLRDYLTTNYPNCTLVEYDTPANCMKALTSGEVDLSFLNSGVAENIIISGDIDQITTVPMANKTFGIALQFHGEDANVLAGIIDKGMQMVDESKINDSLVSYALTTAPEVTLSYLIKQHLPATILIITILVLILLGFTILGTYANVMRHQKIHIEQANRARTDFFSRMSHDMRTPMNGILGMAKLSKDEKDVTILKSNIAKIEESGEYMLSLINDTLDLQRLESGRMKFNLQTVESRPFFCGILDMAEASATQKGLLLKVNLNEIADKSFLQLDPIRVKQILMNLVSNAIKFTPSGGVVKVDIFREQSEEDRERYRFQIQDSGVGMSQEFMKENLFQAYAQEHNQASDMYAGSGLGLAITKNIVELLGGTIAVESELGEGTTFTICLEFKAVNSKEAKESQKTNESQNEQERTGLAGGQILLAEDHALNAEIVIRLLEKAECEVTWAEDGEKAVEIFAKSEKNYYNAILMDIRMPVKNGLEAAREIRKMNREDALTIPIIALSANAYDDDIRACLDAGMDAHIPKPVEPKNLYQTVSKMMKWRE